MTELIFIEGISGVGKSTMVSRIAKDLKRQGLMKLTILFYLTVHCCTIR